jgi:hypothetical protein
MGSVCAITFSAGEKDVLLGRHSISMMALVRTLWSESLSEDSIRLLIRPREFVPLSFFKIVTPVPRAEARICELLPFFRALRTGSNALLPYFKRPL